MGLRQTQTNFSHTTRLCVIIPISGYNYFDNMHTEELFTGESNFKIIIQMKTYEVRVSIKWYKN